MHQPKYFPNYTVEDYQQWEGDWELIDGVPYAMSPSANRRHHVIGSLLARQIGRGLEDTLCKDCIEVQELDWRLDTRTVVRPDVAIICNEKSNYITKPPVLIIEILSISTAFQDRIVKLDIYQTQGVKYYIIVDPEAKSYVTYVLVDGKYQQEDISQFQLSSDCSISIDVQAALKEFED
jgi:Uma2 family endonuclease